MIVQFDGRFFHSNPRTAQVASYYVLKLFYYSLINKYNVTIYVLVQFVFWIFDIRCALMLSKININQCHSQLTAQFNTTCNINTNASLLSTCHQIPCRIINFKCISIYLRKLFSAYFLEGENHTHEPFGMELIPLNSLQSMNQFQFSSNIRTFLHLASCIRSSQTNDYTLTDSFWESCQTSALYIYICMYLFICIGMYACISDIVFRDHYNL